MNDTFTANFRSFYADILHKIGNHLVGVTFLCYFSGFVITNLYLGSLGVVNLDLLRARYILSGVLFLSFLGVIIYLIYGLHQTLLKSRNKPPLRIISDAIWYSLVNVGLLYLVILTATRLAGSPGIPPVGISRLSPPLSWSTWLATAPVAIFRQSVIVFVIAIPIALITVLAWIALDPKDLQNVPTTRRQALTVRLKKPWHLIARLLFVFFLIYIFSIVGSLFSFMGSNQVTDMLSPNTNNTPYLQGGWLRFYLAIAAIYAVVATILIFLLITPRNPKNNDAPSNRWTIFFTTAVVALIVPVYALGIYPDLPQQMGGGKVLQVTVATSNQELKSSFTDKNIETYLIDRTSSSVLFLLVRKSKPEYRTIEVSSPLIESVTYLPVP